MNHGNMMKHVQKTSTSNLTTFHIGLI